jgi:hypothetical protein
LRDADAALDRAQERGDLRGGRDLAPQLRPPVEGAEELLRGPRGAQRGGTMVRMMVVVVVLLLLLLLMMMMPAAPSPARAARRGGGWPCAPSWTS